MGLTRIICQVTGEPSSLSFVWSDGTEDFRPYQLTEQALASFRQNALKARQGLRGLVDAYQADDRDPQWQCLYEIAESGWKLYRSILQRSEEGSLVEAWLKDCQERNDIASVEIVTSGDVSVPWNTIYGVEPVRDAFASYDEAALSHFWGRAYNLASGRRVDPLRRRPRLDDPQVLFVGDLSTIDELEEAGRTSLRNFVEERHFSAAHSKAELESCLRRQSYQLIYWFSHATSEHLYLGDAKLNAQDLFDLLDSLAKKPSGGIAFLNACLTAQVTSGEGAYLSALIECGLSGIIGTEHVIPDYYANQFGLELLEDFLNGSGPIAELMRDLRSKHPLGLLYATCCPPYITITPAALKAGTLPNRLESDPAHAQRPERPGALLGVAAVIAEEEERALPPLPDSPYVALAAYDRSHRALFAGRRADCDRFALILNAPSTRLLILQGATGVGKTSFLRAEVIPFLEEESIGYRFLRRRDEMGTELSVDSKENDSGIIFVRAGKDLVAEFAQAIWDFSVVPYPLRRPNGEWATINLREIVACAGATAGSAVDLVGNLRRDNGLLHQILLALSAALPFAILLIVDQAEEIFTQGQGEAALTALGRIAAATEGNYKIIISLRTEYYGRLVNALRKGSRGANTIREYLLTDFSEDDLVEAITRPTASDPIPYASEIPYKKYEFSFEPELASEIAREVRTYAANSQDSVLPLIQVICTQLFERVPRPGIVTATDLKAIGGVSGGMLRHVETLIETLFPHSGDRAGVKHLLTELYVQHTDGTLTTALLPEEDLESHWRGKMPFREMLAVAADPKYRLLKRGRLRVGEDNRKDYVSLGHDTLANVASRWKRAELEKVRRNRDMIRASATIALLTLIIVLVASRIQVQRERDNLKGQIIVSRAEKLASKSQPFYTALPDVAMILATQASSDYDNLETRSAFMTVLERDPRLLTLLPGHSGGVCRIAFSSDGHILIAQDCTGMVHFWDLATHREVFHRIRMEPKQALGLILLPGNSLLAVANRNGELRYWNVQSGAPAGVCRFAEPLPKDFLDNPGQWRRVAFTPDGAHMAFTESSPEVSFWHLPDCSQEKARKFPAKVREMIFSPDGRLLASGGHDGTVQVLDLGSGRIVASAPGSPDVFGGSEIVDAVAFSPDSSQVAVSYFNGQVNVLPLKGPLETIKTRQSVATAVGFSADASSVGIGTTWTGRIAVWNRKLKEFAQPLEAHSRGLTAIIAAPHGEILASAGKEGHVAIWSLNKSCRLCSKINSSEGIGSATFSPDSHSLAVGTRSVANKSDVAIKIWNGSKLVPLRQGLYASNAVFSSDGKKLAVVSGNELHLIDAVTGRDLVPPLGISKPAQRPFFPLISMDDLGARVAFTSMDKENVQVELWDGHSLKVVPRKPAEVLALRLTSDGRLLVIAETSGNVTFWDAANMREVSPPFKDRIKEHLWKRATISDDGSMLAEGENNIIRLWDLKSRASIAASLFGHSSPGYQLAFSHDGSTLASGSADGTIRLWDVATRQTFGPELNSPSTIAGLEFSRDGKRLLSISKEMSFRKVSPTFLLLWDLDPLHWRTIARHIVNRNLSRQEWQQYVGTVPYRRTFAELP
jgi:WD40 repeat protein